MKPYKFEMRMIPDMDGMYSATTDGRIFSNTTGKFMTPQYDEKANRQRLTLTYKGKRQGFLVHTLIAKTFIPNPDNKDVVMHINGDGKDNRVENLKWVTFSERSAQNPYHYNGVEVAAEVRSKPIVMCDMKERSTVLGIFPSVRAAVKTVFDDYSKCSLVCRCANGKVKSAYGYYWKWAE